MLLFAVVCGVKANPIDVRAARIVGEKFMTANAKTPLRNMDDLQLVATYSINRGDAAFYIFNTSNGFVIVSADDCATPILGYSKEGQFDVNNIPIQLQDYLESFVEQIEYGIENYLETDEQTARQWELVRTVGRLTDNRSEEVVEPLLTTTWNQRYPYNMFVPSGCPTGCTATAMAQIMKYWEWPIQGSGQHSYEWNGQMLSANFGETIYDWDNMIDNYYYSQSTQEQKEAVATLMWHCGVSVDMDYSPDGSGAGLNPGTLINYFNYSYEMNGESLNNCSVASWKARLKDCLNLSRPLYYIGDPSSGDGHAFVCDGYDTNDMFHFNWGWNGSGDGYFSIGALNVSSYDFNYYNYAIFNIHPQGETTNYTINISVNNDEGGTASGGGTFAHGDNVTLTAIADDGYGFCYWEENGGIASTATNYSFTANYNRNLVAVFAGPFTVTLSTEEGGSVSGGGTFYYGEPCLVTATADEGYVFAYWTEEGNVFSYNPNYTFPVTGETHLVAHFVELSDDIIVFADGYVKDLCVTNWDTNGDGLLSYDEAAVVTSIGEVFRGNTTITSFDEVQYFTNLTTISDHAFEDCRNLTILTIPNSVTSIGDYAFGGCSGLTTIALSNAIITIGAEAFFNCSNLTGPLTIPNTVTTIGSYAFYDCRNLTGPLTIPNSVTSVGVSAFRGCSGFTGSLTISNSVTEIGKYTFYGCSGLSGALEIPNSITSIGDHAFYNCRNLTSLIIPNTISIIDDYAFSGCSGLKSMYVYAETPPIVSVDAYYNVLTNMQLYVPCDGVETYQNSDGWNLFSIILGMCSGIITVESDPLDGGEITGSGSYEGGYCCTLEATPNEGYCFANWKENGNVVSMDSIYSFIVTGERSLTAHFILDGIIAFADSNVKAICVANWDINGDGELSYSEATRVTSLGEVFRGNTEITSFEELQYFINLTSIGNYAFSGCNGLSSLTIPNSVTSIGLCAFSGCSGMTGDLTIPNSVTSIGSYAFYGCSNFNGNLIISNSVTSIGTSAFQNCSGLASVVIGNSVTSISSDAFQNCSSLTSVTIGNSVTSIGDRTFRNCSGLTSLIVLAEMSPVLSSYSFYGCRKSIPVYVPCGSVEAYTTVNWGGFSNILGMCGGTVTVVADSEESGTVTGGGSYEAGQTCTVIATANDGYVFAVWTRDGIIVSNSDEYTFYVTDDMTLVAHFVPEGNIVFADANVKNICVSQWDTNGDAKLSYAEAASVTSLGLVFKNNTEITSFEELQYFINLSLIDNYAFYNCSGLTSSLIIPNTVISIGNSAFSGCSGLTGDLTIPNSVISIGDYAFQGCNGFIGNLTLGNSITSIGSNVFYGCSNLTGDLVIPNSVTSIGGKAFYNCSGFTGDLTIPNSVTSIGNYAFYGCDGFTGNLIIGNSITSIGSYVFYGCSNLTGDLVIPNSVTSIGSRAFYNCSGFTGDLTIPNSVTLIGSYAFQGCSGFTGSLIIPNSVTSINDFAFQGCSGFTGLLTIPNSVTTIGNSAFCNCSGLSGLLTIPDSVTTIGNSAFDNCSGMTGSLTIPNSVTSIGNFAFRNCRGLTGSLTIPNSVISIGNYAFYNCRGFVGSLTIPNAVTSIGDCAFYFCSGLSGSLTIPNSVTMMGYSAFNGCSNLTSITVHAETPPTIYSSTFLNCPKSIPVHVPCGSMEAYQSAAYWNEFTNIQEDCNSLTAHFIANGDWSDVSNWQSGALPGADDVVYIDAPCQLDMDAEVVDLTITANQSLTLQAGKTLIVTGTLTNTSTTGLVIEDGAQLWHNSDNVMATVKKYIVGHDTLRRRFSVISTPMTTSVNPEDASTHLTNGDYDLYGWLAGSPDSLEWRNYKANPFMLSPDGNGFLYAHLGDVELSFPGVLRRSDIDYGKAVIQVAGEDFHYNGWNLIGNPFACEAYLVDENGEPLPYYRMKASGRDFEAASGAIAPMESVFYVAPESGTVYFTRNAPVQEEEPLDK